MNWRIIKLKNPYRVPIGFALTMLLLSLVFGVISAIAFFAPNFLSDWLPFQQVRPFHVSAALFWIITGAVGGILYYNREMLEKRKLFTGLFVVVWILTCIAIFIAYCFHQYGGREYWEFPPFLNLFLLVAWVFLLIGFLPPLVKIKGEKPVYIWMWSTGLLFFLFTFVEQNLWHIPWFRESFLKEMTIQWKSNGSMVGAWNQMVYGTALYLMVKISGDDNIAKSWKAYASYFLGLTNLIFNWGHHIYNVPSASWIRDVAYGISMTEWILVISIIQGFRSKLEERRRFRHLVSYRFLIAAEFWIFLNLLLALMMSIPAINRYTHGTHITVAHAMGTTIGINTMILLGSICYIIQMKGEECNRKFSTFNVGYWCTQVSLFVFWIALIAAGLIKGLRMAADPGALFVQVMEPVYPVLKIFMYSGIVLAVALMMIGVLLLKRIRTAQMQ